MDSLLAICFPGQSGPGTDCVAPPSDIPSGNIAETILRNGMTILIIVAVVLVIIYLIWGGIKWIMSRGDKQQVQSARSGITYALIGLVVVFLAFFIISVIGYLFNVQIFQ